MEAKRTIKIWFVDMYENLNPTRSIFYVTLSRHYEVILDPHPDYLFYSVFGNEHLKYDCIRIFWTGENQTPDFNVCDYALGYEGLTLRDRYFTFPYYYLYQKDFALMAAKHTMPVPADRRFCSFVYSNNYASPERKQVFDLLSAYKPIDSGGRFMNNVGGPVADKLAFQQQHKFAIAFENCSQPGYTTEKLMQAFAAQTIPIYWGDPTIAERFNTRAFVNCHDYASLEEAVEQVKRIDNDDALYRSMLAEPAMCPGTDTLDTMYAKVEQFLLHIVEQPLDKAQRYSRQYWGRKYNQKMLLRDKIYRRSLYAIAASLFYRWFRTEKVRKNKILWAFNRFMMRVMKRN